MVNNDIEKKNRQFVIFKLGDQEFGVDIHKVSIVEKYMNITRVPTTPSYIKGVINLRGEIIPVMSLREKFGLPEIEVDDDTRIIIFKFGEIVMGVIVDIVSEVAFYDEDNIESVTSITNDRSLDYIIGIAKYEGRLITLLNIEKFALELMSKEVIEK
ncbi:MAG: chemotaxis protein CheW [Clostridiaceae bacterium]|nr:chemotaxis protein CheW [Clostridiaceae bacterium]